MVRNMRPPLPLLLALLMAIPPLAGCETVHEPMTYERCSSADLCTLRGHMTPVQAGQAWMGKLDLADGRCVSVSLPAQMLRELQESGGNDVTVRGRVRRVPANTEVMTVEGRTIGLGTCGDFILFVYD
jgi:hypothetical protein